MPGLSTAHPQHGFLETLRTHDGKPDMLGSHLLRLAEAGVEFDRAELEVRIRTALVGREGDAMIRILADSGGVSFELSDLPEHATADPSIAVELVTADVPGYAYPHKSTDRTIHDELLADAQVRGAFDALILDQGKVIETTRANLLIATENQLVTAPFGRCLPGITRAALLSIAPHFQTEPIERELTLDDLHDAEEVMICNSLIGVRRVAAIDGRVLADSDHDATGFFNAFLLTWYGDST